jgi:hypothetical protein
MYDSRRSDSTESLAYLTTASTSLPFQIRQTVPSLVLREDWTNSGLTWPPYNGFFSYFVKTPKNPQNINLAKVACRTQQKLKHDSPTCYREYKPEHLQN